MASGSETFIPNFVIIVVQMLKGEHRDTAW
jgi:hypothetical protein